MELKRIASTKKSILVKVLNLYTNIGAKIRENSNRNPNSKFASKKVWVQKTQPR